MASMHGSEPIAAHKIGAHLLIQPIIIEQTIQLKQHWVDLLGQFGHAGKHIFGRITVDEHAASLLLRRASLLILPSPASSPPCPVWAKPLQIAPENNTSCVTSVP